MNRTHRSSPTGDPTTTMNLINPRQVFVPRLRLHQLADGSHDAVVNYREILLRPLETSNGSTAIRHNPFGHGANRSCNPSEPAGHSFRST